MFRFEHNELLILLLIVPVIIIIYLFSLQFKKKALASFGESKIIGRLMEEISSFRPNVKFLIMLISITFLILSIAGPQFGSKLEDIKRKGVEIVIALDVSNSMLAEDIKPNRLESAKRAISGMVDRLNNDKIGLIVFAGDAYTQIPMTMDYSATKMFLSSINTEIISKQGTSVGSAIELGMNSFSPDNEKSRALVIITDGENHEEGAIEAAQQAVERGITIHTIGMGLIQGAPIPVYNQYGNIDYKTDEQGEVVVSKLNEQILQEIASTGNGKYIRANNTKTGLNALFDEINKMEKEEINSRLYSDYEERFQWLAGISLLLLLIDFIILERKNRFLKNVNLFGRK
ncbi:VWA domain-containing protein [Bacteroidota bacterium]